MEEKIKKIISDYRQRSAMTALNQTLELPQDAAGQSLAASPCSAMLGAWGITDGEGYLTHGGSLERAEDIMWSMKNESEDWKGKNLFLVWCKWEEFNQPLPWFQSNLLLIVQKFPLIKHLQI